MQGLMTSITGRAVQQKKIDIDAVNIRDYTQDKHGRVDDYPYGGGAGDAHAGTARYMMRGSLLWIVLDTSQGRFI